MAQTLRYGDENLASFPDNVSQLITPVNVRDLIVSSRSGGVNIIDSATFTITITDGVPVLVNPLLPAPEVGGVLWVADANNRAIPNYAAAIPDLIIPTDYSKFVQIFWTLGVNKIGAGEDSYLFQAEVDGTPVGGGLTITLSTSPQTISFLANITVKIDTASAIGLAVTGVGTDDDIEVSPFEQMLIDFQIWKAPTP